MAISNLMRYEDVEQLPNRHIVAPRVEYPQKQQSSTYTESLQPGLSPFMLAPLPPIQGVNPDSLRQFYRGGVVPQYRLMYSGQ